MITGVFLNIAQPENNWTHAHSLIHLFDRKLAIHLLPFHDRSHLAFTLPNLDELSQANPGLPQN
jgi:hypothetical protein